MLHEKGLAFFGTCQAPRGSRVERCVAAGGSRAGELADAADVAHGQPPTLRGMPETLRVDERL